jgi:hypothetical protein
VFAGLAAAVAARGSPAHEVAGEKFGAALLNLEGMVLPF